MPASASIGNELRFKYLKTSVSPNAWTIIDAAVDVGDFGEEKPLLDITTLTSTAREYRNGLADGLEIPLTMNFTPNNADFATFYAAYQADTLLSFRITALNSSPQYGFQFNATIRSWKINAQVGEKATASFSLKISGSVSQGAYP
jgi:hypothetical protein